jgi:membrane-associated phospholipid phosphatase
VNAATWTSPLRGLPNRILPRSSLDLVWQALLIAGAYVAWRYARGALAGDASAALDHGWDLVRAEQALHLFVEADLQSWAIANQWPADIASWVYANAHFKGSVAALAVIYFAHRRSFSFVRNMLIVAMAISLLGYALYPTAPPRLLGELGFVDTAAVTGQNPPAASPDALYNPYAAVPSMHVGFALMLGWSLALLARSWLVKASLAAYPLLITFAVLATGNHYWLDALAGALVAAASAGVAVALGRMRPEWSFHGRPRIVGRTRDDLEAGTVPA